MQSSHGCQPRHRSADKLSSLPAETEGGETEAYRPAEPSYSSLTIQHKLSRGSLPAVPMDYSKSLKLSLPLFPHTTFPVSE